LLAQALERAFQINPTGTALVSDAGRLNWEELGARISRIAGGLRRLGIRPGDRVAVLASNSIEHFELIYGVCWAGGAIVPLNFRLAPAELAYLYEHSEASLLAFDENQGDLAAEVISRCKIESSLFLGAGSARRGGKFSYDADLIAAPAVAPHYRGRDELAGIFYTGGTTGLPKGVMISDGALSAQSVNMMHDAGLTGSSVHLHATPVFHIASFGFAWAAVYAAAGQACLARFEPDAVCNFIRKAGVNSMMIVPSMIDPLLHSSLSSRDALQLIESITYGAAPITQNMLNTLISGFPNARFQQFYGQTEATGPCLKLAPDDHKPFDGRYAHLHTAGRSTSTYLVKIVDEQGAELPRGEPGEILVSGPGLMSGYWRDEELTNRTIVENWLKTGDVGIMDRNGYVAIVDRIKDMIVSGGENVFSSEVENALAVHPAVAQCAVIGLPDEKWGEIVCAIVMRKPNTSPSEQELIDFCRSRIGGYKCPKRILIQDEPLPLSGVGKVQKNVLRKIMENSEI
jgi:long-chain acyl-CoA synthetase